MYPLESLLTHDLRFDLNRRMRGQDKDQVLIRYGYGEAWFGRFLAGFTRAGLCWFEPNPAAGSEQRMLKHWAPARGLVDQAGMHAQLQLMLASRSQPQKLHLCGTAWQLKVWDALLDVPRGGVVSYGDLAKMLGNPRAARALGNAVAANHIAVLVPCHRVKPAAGGVGNYRWGAKLKGYLLNYESGRSPAAA